MSMDLFQSKDDPGNAGPGSPRQGKSWALTVVAGLVSALLFLSVAAQLIAPLPLLLLGLGSGTAALAGGAVVGMLAVGARTGVLGALVYAAMVVLPALIVTRQGLLWRSDRKGTVHWYPPGLLLAWLSVAAVLLMLAGAALTPDNPQGFEGAVHDYVVMAADMLAGNAPQQDRDLMIRLWVPLFPAMAAGVWLLMAAVNGCVAQALLTRLRHNRRPTPAYRELWLPTWLTGALAAALVVAFAASGDPAYLGRNAAVVLLVPFAFLGLASIHDMARRQANSRLLLGIFYVVFFLLSGWAIVAVAGLGLMRHWVRLRRIKSGGSDQEEE